MSFRPLGSLARYGNSKLARSARCTIVAAKILALTHLFYEYGYCITATVGPSMLPTFQVTGDWILVSKRHRYGRDVGVGDLVAYNIPVSFDIGVKRVLGMPGDYVMVDNPESGSKAMIQIPKGHCWVVGDNLAASRDSRLYGPVPLALVRGKIIAKVLPYWKFDWIQNPLCERRIRES